MSNREKSHSTNNKTKKNRFMPHEFDNLSGGSASDAHEGGAGKGMDFFQPTVREVLRPTNKNIRSLMVRLLPSFDRNLHPADAAYQMSVMPYRVGHAGQPDVDMDSENKGPAFTPWYQKVYGYPFFGKSKTGILSPRTLALAGYTAMDARCPFEDIRNTCYNNDVPEWKRFISDDQELGGKTLASRPVLVLMNGMWESDGKGWKQGIVVMKDLGLTDLKDQACWPTPHMVGREPVNPFWPEYLLGDFTDPMNGLVGPMVKAVVGTIETYCIRFATDYTGKPSKMPIGPDQLRARYRLNSSATLKIPTKEEIVEFLLQDGIFPRSLLRAACGHYANIPDEGPTYASASTAHAPSLSAPSAQAPISHPAAPSYSASGDFIPGLPGDPSLSEAPSKVQFAPNELMFFVSNGMAYQAPASEVEAWLRTLPVQQAEAVLVQPASKYMEQVPVTSTSIGEFLRPAPVVHQPPAVPQYAPQPMAPQPMAAPQYAPQPMAPQPMAAPQYAPQPMAPQYAPQPMAPQPMAAPQYAPQPMAPQYAPQPMAPQPMAAPQYAPQPMPQQAPTAPQYVPQELAFEPQPMAAGNVMAGAPPTQPMAVYNAAAEVQPTPQFTPNANLEPVSPEELAWLGQVNVQTAAPGDLSKLMSLRARAVANKQL